MSTLPFFSQPFSPFVSLYLLPLGFLILTKIPSCSSRDDDWYTKCSSSNFTCGSLTATYPFWGASRPVGCGIPELQLTCEAETAAITIKNVKYRVIDIDPDAQTMRIARQDFMSGLCPSQFLNTSLDPPLIDYLPGYTNVTFLYGCWIAPVVTPVQLSCAVPGTSYEGGFVTAGDFMAGVCHTSVSFPVRTDILTEILNLTLLQDGIRQGFGVKWDSSGDGFACGDCVRSGGVCGYDVNTRKAACYCLDQSTGAKLCPASTADDPANSYPDNISCNACKLSGGRCEFNSSSGAFSCYCSHQSYVSICPMNPKSQSESSVTTTTIKSEKDSKNAALPIGIGIGGAAIFGIFLGFLFLIVAQRRKRKAAAENQSKDLLSQPPISKNKNVHTPPVDLSLSIPPYPYSKSCPKSDPQKESSYFGLQVFSFTELEEATDNFNPDKELGSGGYGSVYHGILRDGRSVAVKRLFDNSMKREEQFMNEVEILNRLRHRNLVTLYGCTSRRTRELVFVYEYVPNGTVADHIHGDQSKSRFLEWPVRLSIAIETADALAYLHTSDVIHRDVKTNNILLDNKFRVKVADFGLSRLFPTNATHVSTAPQGTPGYVDPEYYNTYQLTDKSDVYSFGVVLVELISSLPAVDTSRHRLNINLANMAVTKIQSGSITELIDPRFRSDKDNAVQKMTTSIAELAFRCLQQERDMRPTMNEVHETLRRIQTENCPTVKCETVVDIGEDNVSLLKQVSPPFSPDSVETDQWISSSTLSSS